MTGLSNNFGAYPTYPSVWYRIMLPSYLSVSMNQSQFWAINFLVYYLYQIIPSDHPRYTSAPPCKWCLVVMPYQWTWRSTKSICHYKPPKDWPLVSFPRSWQASIHETEFVLHPQCIRMTFSHLSQLCSTNKHKIITISRLANWWRKNNDEESIDLVAGLVALLHSLFSLILPTREGI